MTADLSEVAINGFPILEIEKTRIVPLGFSTNTDGTYTLSATNLDYFDMDISVILEDVKLNHFEDLRASGSYSFVSEAGTDNSRFRLHFGASVTGIQNPGITESLALFVTDNKIAIQAQDDALLEIYNVTGELITSQNISPGLNITPCIFSPGIYIVKASNGNEFLTKKLLICD